MRHLPRRLVPILHEVVLKYHPEGLSMLKVDGSPTLDLERCHQLRQSCTDELCATGLTYDDEPNERGYLLEELIDWLGQVDFQKDR